LTFQQQRLRLLVHHATEHSPFYRELYGTRRRGDPVPLQELPVVNKALVLDNFERLVTDPRLKLDRLEAHVRDMAGDEHYLDTYHVFVTAGSSGRRGIFVFECAEWAAVLASWLRCSRLMGIERGSATGIRFASVAGNSPAHTTYRMATSLDIGVPRSLRLDVTALLAELVAALNAFQPEMVLLYPSMASILAGEQIEGRLRIRPRLIVTAAEWRTPESERLILEAWGVAPFNYYAMTEGPVGIDCAFHRGIHVFDDLCIVEVVDGSNRPVPEGARGDKILFTNLLNYTQPLIRYEVTDLLAMSPEPCPCGRPFSLIAGIEGRIDDVLYLESVDGGTVPIHPNHFLEAMKGLAGVTRYRVVEREDGIDVLVMASREITATPALAESVLNAVRSRLESAHVASLPLRVHFVDDVRGDPQLMGKLKLVESLRTRAPRPGVGSA
jgi:phenylacetate-coenzyme A ligase PaaK-like adenylate-forming protein